MKLALVIERFDPTLGGAERSTAQMADELIGLGHDVTVITAYCPDTLKLPGVTVKRMTAFRHMGISKIWRFTRWARRKLQQGDYDVSVSMTSLVPADIMQPRGIVREMVQKNQTRRCNGRGRLFSRICHPLSFRRQLRLRLEKSTFADQQVRHFVAISNYMAGQLKNHYSINGQCVTVIPNGSKVTRMTDEERAVDRNLVRQSFGIDEAATVYLFPAIEPWRKGAVPLFKAMQRLGEMNFDFKVMVAGCQEYNLHRLACAMGIDHHIRFLGLTNEIEKVYAAADVTVLPTYYDPASKVIIESLMMGVPAISTDFNGASELISDGNGMHRGLVVKDPDDIEGLTAAMYELADPVVRQACAAACAGLDEQLSMACHVQQLVRVLQKVAEAQD